MIPEKMMQVLEHEGVVAIATQSVDGPHLVNTWNSYVKVTDDDRLLIPAGYMNETEANINKSNKVLLTVGARAVDGFNGPGTGFLIEGIANFVTNGAQFDEVKQKFPWARAALEVQVKSAKQTL